MIIVWKLDRWGCSVNDLFHTLNDLNNLGVGFISLTEALSQYCNWQSNGWVISYICRI
ncbi:recombinase family protein [Legionella cincinnatiensis]|uniref:recombinase family protein n=1 Tax=Legionella cincinnatiensis TaxID=28085 RepID=UPI00138F2521